MRDFETHASAAFDEYALEYDAALEKGISVSGEHKDYFAHGRIAWLSRCLREINERPASVMDFGCGTGSGTPHFFDLLNAELLLGVDSSVRSLEVAQRNFGSANARFELFSDYQPSGTIDLSFCNGVFHHIPPEERREAVSYVHRSLRSGGLFAFWENNPWNPGTRYVMSRIPFDRDAIPLSPPVARKLLVEGGFQILRTDFQFIFPKALSWFRAIEPHVAQLPFGAQYQVLCRKN